MREKHLFEFPAGDIAEAAKLEAVYHEEREQYWRSEYARSVDVVRGTARVKITEYPVTGGMRADVTVDYGDLSAYNRMTESFSKADNHRLAAERFRIEERLYSTQSGRVYELDSDDVAHYRLGGEPREE